MAGDTSTADLMWLLGALIGLVWWPGQFFTLVKKKTSVEHNVGAWVIATVGCSCSVVAGYLFENQALFWSMAGYWVLHVSMLGVIIWFRKRPGGSRVSKASA